MTFSDKFLSALGAWQLGWREQPERRLKVAAELRKAVEEEELETKFRAVSSMCYRKRYGNPPIIDGVRL